MNTQDNSKRGSVESTDLLDGLLWRLEDIREELMSTGVSGRCYNCDEWSTPVVNITSAIRLIKSEIQSNAEVSDR